MAFWIQRKTKPSRSSLDQIHETFQKDTKFWWACLAKINRESDFLYKPKKVKLLESILLQLFEDFL